MGAGFHLVGVDGVDRPEDGQFVGDGELRRFAGLCGLFEVDGALQSRSGAMVFSPACSRPSRRSVPADPGWRAETEPGA